jgi:hypothetical protein
VVLLGNHLVVVLEILLVDEALDILPGAVHPLEEALEILLGQEGPSCLVAVHPLEKALEILLGQAGPSCLVAVPESQLVRDRAAGLHPYFDSLAVVPLLRGVLLPSLPHRLVARSISMQQGQL